MWKNQERERKEILERVSKKYHEQKQEATVVIRRTERDETTQRWISLCESWRVDLSDEGAAVVEKILPG